MTTVENLSVVANATNTFLEVSNFNVLDTATVGSLTLSNKMTGSNVLEDYTLSTNLVDSQFYEALMTSGSSGPWINVKDYGATGNNNAAADSAGIAAAFNVWTNTGGVLYFPNGSYNDTNTYCMSYTGPQGRPSHPFVIAGDSPGVSSWNAKVTNATFITFKGVLPDIRNIAFVDAGSGTNNGIFVTKDTRQAFWYNVVVKGFAGCGADLQGSCGGLVHGSFGRCGVGLKMPGYCDGWEGHLRLDQNRVGLQVGGYASAFPSRVSANGTRWQVVGNHNDIGVLIVGASRGVTIGGYFEYNTNGMVHIGYPAGYSEGLGGGSTDRIGPVEINCMSGRWSTNNATSLYPNWCPGVVVATNCIGLTVRNIGSIGAPDIYLANASAYLTPIIMENYQYGTIGYPDYRLYGPVAYGPGYGVTYKNAHMLWQSRSSTNVVAYMSNGVFVATSVTGTNLYGNGSGITGLNADMLASGTVPLDRLSGLTTNYPIGNGDVLNITNGVIIGISRE